MCTSIWAALMRVLHMYDLRPALASQQGWRIAGASQAGCANARSPRLSRLPEHRVQYAARRIHGAPVQAHSEYHHILRASASVVALNRSASADIGHGGRLTGQLSAQAPLIHSAWIHSSTRSCILTGTECV